MRTLELGGLTAHVVGGTDGDGGGDGPVIVLCHGFGASGDDLVGLADALALPARVRLVFPEAPLALPPEYGGYGRMWWMVDFAERERAIASGKPRDMAASEPPGLGEAGKKLVSLLDAVRTTLSVRDEDLVIGGFSQGAMVACEVVLTTTRAFAGLVILSGALLTRDRWVPAMRARAGLRAFASHGTHDQMLPYAGAEALVAALDGAGVDVKLASFRGGHEIPQALLPHLERFILEVLPDAR